MSTESENLYTKNDQLMAQIYDNLSGENKSEEAISLLLNPNHISPTEQVKILGLLGEKDERFHSLLIKKTEFYGIEHKFIIQHISVINK